MKKRRTLSTARPVLRDGGSIHINPANRGKFTATMRRTGKNGGRPIS